MFFPTSSTKKRCVTLVRLAITMHIQCSFQHSCTGSRSPIVPSSPAGLPGSQASVYLDNFSLHFAYKALLVRRLRAGHTTAFGLKSAVQLRSWLSRHALIRQFYASDFAMYHGGR